MWKKLSSKVLLEHPRLIVEEDQIKLKSGKVVDYLRYGHGGDGVVLVARNGKDEILFNKEYSYIPDRSLLQLPMGKIEGDESPEEAGNRELQEETGLKAKSLVIKGSYYQNHRRSDNKGVVLLATDLVASPLEGDAEEEGIEDTVWVPAKNLSDLIAQGEIVDADTLSSLRLCGL